ncbi:MAG: hypothetical protein AB1817_00665 [Chloroflexota bacterium]
MKKAFNEMIKEIKQGENLDIYVTILLAIVVAVLGITPIVDDKVIAAVTLATLALLATSLLGTRRASSEMKDSYEKLATNVRRLEDKIEEPSHISDFLIRAYPDFTEQFKKAKRVSIEGSTLSSTVTRYFAEFQQLLQRGGSLRILVTKATPEVLAMQVFRSSSIKDPVLMKNTSESNLAMIKSMADKVPNPALLEVRTMPYLASYSLFIIESEDGTSKIYAKLLPFQKPEPESPTLELHSKHDSKWFQFFFDQYERLWKASDKA